MFGQGQLAESLGKFTLSSIKGAFNLFAPGRSMSVRVMSAVGYLTFGAFSYIMTQQLDNDLFRAVGGGSTLVLGVTAFNLSTFFHSLEQRQPN